jgi:excisionase family DNA binding protein
MYQGQDRRGRKHEVPVEETAQLRVGLPPQPILFTTLLTPSDAAAYLSVSRAKVYELFASGQLKSFWIGRSRKVLLADPAEFIDPQRGLSSC